MKIITLNTWGGQAGREGILSFFNEHKDVDIFCLQEIYHKSDNLKHEYKKAMLDIFSDIQNVLTEHVGYFRPSIKYVGKEYGIALFINKGIEVLDEGEELIYFVSDYISGGNHSRNLQYARFLKDEKEYTVINVHGLWNGKGKTDTEDRIKQSTIIKECVESAKGLKILCGDFNLRPDTQSISILEKGMRNLIKEYGITSTRTEFYDKPEKYADYVFLSPEIEVKEFKVLPEQVSDHAALFLEI